MNQHRSIETYRLRRVLISLFHFLIVLYVCIDPHNHNPVKKQCKTTLCNEASWLRPSDKTTWKLHTCIEVYRLPLYNIVMM